MHVAPAGRQRRAGCQRKRMRHAHRRCGLLASGPPVPHQLRDALQRPLQHGVQAAHAADELHHGHALAHARARQQAAQRGAAHARDLLGDALLACSTPSRCAGCRLVCPP